MICHWKYSKQIRCKSVWQPYHVVRRVCVCDDGLFTTQPVNMQSLTNYLASCENKSYVHTHFIGLRYIYDMTINVIIILWKAFMQTCTRRAWARQHVCDVWTPRGVWTSSPYNAINAREMHHRCCCCKHARARVACWHNNVIICQCAPTAASTHVCEWVIAFFGRACVCVRMVFVKHMRECFVYWRDKRRPPNAMIATMASLIRHMVRGRVPCGQRLCYYDGIYGAHIPRERVRQR